MGRFIDLTGQTFARWTVIRRATNAGNSTRWLCRCRCGTVAVIHSANLRHGVSKSCGCLREEVSKTTLRTHGMKNHPLYVTWESMHKRCNNPNNKDWKYFGGRGIKVCDRWSGRDGFPSFLADMGDRPPGLSLDRTDNEGNYEPANCRWATWTEQVNNRRPWGTAVTVNG